MSLVDWNLAGRVAETLAGGGTAAAPPGLDATCERAAATVIDYTGLEPAEDLPGPEWIDRPAWTRANLQSMRVALDPLEARLESEASRSPLARPVEASLGKLLAIQAGGVIGYASRRVLGQYEPGFGDRAPRLLFVGPNLAGAEAGIGGGDGDLLEWIALHEVTHAVQFGAVPWLRERIAGLIAEVLTSARPSPSPAALLSAAGGLLRRDPRDLVEELRRSDPLLLLAPGEARGALEAIQATMSAVEGYAEHVMDAAAHEGAQVEAMRERLERRRAERGPIPRLIAWLLGFELKLRQYREGKRFCDEVAGTAGIAGLNRVWDSPSTVPSLAELRDPGRWLERSAFAAPGAAG